MHGVTTQGLTRVLRSVTFWAAVVSASGAIGAGLVTSNHAARVNRDPGYCLLLLRETREWAEDYPEDAKLYEQAGRAADPVPDLWTASERERCSGDPELILERSSGSSLP